MRTNGPSLLRASANVSLNLTLSLGNLYINCPSCRVQLEVLTWDERLCVASCEHKTYR